MSELFAFIIVAYLLYVVASFVWLVIQELFHSLSTFADRRYKAQMRRIVRNTESQRQALSEVFESEMRHITDAAARDITRG
jgi:hypothetical protein